MLPELFTYRVVDEAILRQLAPGQACALVYDKKPEITDFPAVLYDVNSFKIATWKNTFQQHKYKVVIFQLKRLPVDLVYTLLKNTYNKLVIFTEDTERTGRLLNPQTHSATVNILPSTLPHGLRDSEIFARLAGHTLADMSDASRVHRVSVLLYEFVQATQYKINMLTAMAAKRQVAVLSANDLIARICPEIPSARSVTDRANMTCFVFDMDESFNYAGFRECVFFVSGTNTHAVEPPAAVSDELIVASCSLLQELRLVVMSHAVAGALTLVGFRSFLHSYGSEPCGAIVKACAPDTSAFEFLKLKEITIGNVLLPLVCARQLFEHVLWALKTTLEQSLLYVRSMLPTVNYTLGGFKMKETCAVVSLPGIFDFTATSDFYITKKDAMCDASAKFITKLIETGILDANLDVVPAALLGLRSVADLYMKAYKTSDIKEIAERHARFISSQAVTEDGCVLEKDGEIVLKNRTVEEFVEGLFKRTHMIDISAPAPAVSHTNSTLKTDPGSSTVASVPTCTKQLLETFYRRLPESFTNRTSTMALYVFSNSKTGVLCAEAFNENCKVFNELEEAVEISYGGTKTYTNEELKILSFYQIIFFKMHIEVFFQQQQAMRLFYYVAPLDDNGQVDWDYLNLLYSNFLLDYVHKRRTAETLVWNPFTREFYVYAGTVDKRLEDPVESTTFLTFFENKYKVTLSIRSGKMIFKGYIAEHILSALKKRLNIERDCSKESEYGTVNPRSDTAGVPKKPRPVAPKESDYSIVSPRSDTAGVPKYAKFPELPPLDSLNMNSFIVSSMECCFRTPVKTSILMEVEVFKRNYSLLEDALTAHDLGKAYALDLPLKEIITCFTQSAECSHDNYERLEFIGDSVLKFVTTNYLYLHGLSMDTIVSAKDQTISNPSLFNRCVESGLHKYIKGRRFSPKMVQAPYIDGITECLKYFNAIPIFNSDNYASGISREAGSPDLTVKMYADAVEALIGALYTNCGIHEAIKFMYRLGILKKLEDIRDAGLDALLGGEPDAASHYTHTQLTYCSFDKIGDSMSMFPGQPFKSFQYVGLLAMDDVRAVENAIGYSFTNPGNLERALIHPSFINTLGSVDFQFLELIGDCSLDMFVVAQLFQNKTLKTPLLLHTAKKTYVNNYCLCDIFKKLELDRYAKFLLPAGVRSKAYSDIVEAMIGAILVDVQWNSKAFLEVMGRKLKFLFEESKAPFVFE